MSSTSASTSERPLAAAGQALRVALIAAGCALAGCGGGNEDSSTLPAAATDAAPGRTTATTGITLPAGFAATIFADGLPRPRHIAVRDNGDVFVALRSGGQQVVPSDSAGGIAVLRDSDGDGIADARTRFGRNDVDTGIAIHDGYVYFSSATAVYAAPLSTALAPTAEPELVVGGFGDSGAGHSAKPIAIDGEGHLYLQAGVPSNACQTEDRQTGSPGLRPCPELERFGGIWRFSAAARGQDQQGDGIRFSTGHRNAVALEWHPLANRLYLVMHGRDQLDQLWPAAFTAEQRIELPAEELHVVAQGDDLGWPYTYYDHLRGQRMVAPEYGGDGRTAAEPGRYKEPLLGFPGHWAPNDLLFYTGTHFPARYRGGAFVAFHGSWNRQPAEQDGYSVVFVPFADGAPAGGYEIFADDFEGPERVTSPAEADHRPTGLAEGPDGALYVSDDVGGRIWRITYTEP